MPRFKISQILELCDSISPFNTQESWDKSGLNLGSVYDEFEEIVLCLEATLPIAFELKPYSLLITHHPLFFRPLEQFLTHSYPSNIATELIRKHCSLISLHTNFDKSHLNAYLTHKILKFEHFYQSQNGLMMSGNIPPTPIHTLIAQLKEHLQIANVRFTPSIDSQPIRELHIVCGSGCSFLSHITPNSHSCLITGDVKHHDAFSAQSMGISLIDIGHYESEKYFGEILQPILQNAGYNAIIADCKNPFHFA